MTTEGGNSGQELAQAEHDQLGEQVPLAAWLDDLEAERRALIMRLRQVEKNLLRYGRLREPTGRTNRSGR